MPSDRAALDIAVARLLAQALVAEVRRENEGNRAEHDNPTWAGRALSRTLEATTMETTANTLPQNPTAARSRRELVYELTEEGLARENHELRDRAETVNAYRDLAVAALEMVVRLTKRNHELACRMEELKDQLRDLLGAQTTGQAA